MGRNASGMWEREPAVLPNGQAPLVLLSSCFLVSRLAEPSAFIFCLLTAGHFGVF